MEALGYAIAAVVVLGVLTWCGLLVAGAEVLEWLNQ